MNREVLRSPRPKRLIAATIATLAFAFVAVRVIGLESGATERAFCIALMLSVALLFGVASGRAAFGASGAALLMGAVWLAASLKLNYLHEPLMAPDLRYFAGTLTHEVIGHYPGMLRKCVIAVVGGVALMALLWHLESPGAWRGRGILRRALASLLAALPLLVCVWPRGPFHSVYATPTWEFISQGEQHPISNFVRSFAELHIAMPARAAHADAAQWQADAPPSDAAVKPDIVAVLEESTLDPRQWADCTVPRCTVPMFEPDSATRAHGPLRVHTYGGATWTSEFTFFAGISQSTFGPAGIYAPYNLAPRLRESLPRQLKALGYRTVAMYSMPANFVNAASAYRDYGFDEFHDAHELGLKWESTDEELFAKVEALHARLRREDERPLFFMVLTMRQHGPHDYPLDTLPPPWNVPPAPALGERLNRNLATYLFRLHQSDAAIAHLRSALFAAGRPALLVHFGDHHPSFDGLEVMLRNALRGETDQDALNDTYYRVDTNFPAPQFHSPRVLDLAFLDSVVLDVAGLPKNAYFAANARLRERCAGLLDHCPQDTLESYFAYVIDTLHAIDE